MNEEFQELFGGANQQRPPLPIVKPSYPRELKRSSKRDQESLVTLRRVLNEESHGDLRAKVQVSRFLSPSLCIIKFQWSLFSYSGIWESTNLPTISGTKHICLPEIHRFSYIKSMQTNLEESPPAFFSPPRKINNQ